MGRKAGNHKSKWMIIAIILFFVIIAAGVGAFMIYESNKMPEATVVLYDGPDTLPDATPADLEASPESSREMSLMHCVDTMVKVNGEDCYVYDTNVNHTHTWYTNYEPPLSRTPITYFDFEGEVKIEVTVPEQDLEKVTISPLSYGIEPKIDKKNHTITFNITQPDTYTITFNDSPERAVHIFANPLEEDIPDPNDENVIYIGPGEVKAYKIDVESGQTVYIAGGAVVHGRITVENEENVTIRGRGIMDSSNVSGWKGTGPYIPLEINNSQNVTVEGIMFLNANAWVCQGYTTKGLVMDGVKIISARPNGDGVSLQSCQDVVIKNGFVRSWDDSLVVKNYAGDSSNILFSNMQIWTDLAQSMEIGYETNKGRREDATITDVTFEDITVLHNYHKPVISIHNADDAIISGITFRNIVVEDAQMGEGDGNVMPYLIDLHIAQNASWSSTEERGQITDVTIDGVKVLGGKFCTSRIQGYDEEHKITNVSISNLEILGEKITDFETGKFIIHEPTTENITIQ
uniref:glycosyl hydrolase family 28 protein n=1 Tax=Acetatifactor sp. TaxID=1872090 RepID=UPI004055A76A